MSTLTQPKLSALLERLFREADESERILRGQNLLSPPDRLDYRELYARLKDHPLAVSRSTGTLLYLLARAVRARNIVEFGVSFGISTLHLAAALQDNGGGRLIGAEFEATKLQRAREHLVSADLAQLVELRGGDALDSLARDLPETIDFVLLDGAKDLYPRILQLVEPSLRIGAVIVADNADANPEYVAHVRAPGGGYVSVAFAADVEVSMRLAAGEPERGLAA